MPEPEPQPLNTPPQTGIIDFLRRIAAVDNDHFKQAFIQDREGLMELCGLTEPQRTAIRSGSIDAITAAIATEFIGGVGPDYIRVAHVVVPGLDYQFIDEKNLPGVVQIITDLRRSVKRLTQQIDQLSQRLQ